MACSLVYAAALCCCLWLVNAQNSRPYYTAAVYEHLPLGSPETDSANFIIESNLDYYKRATEIAKSKEADVIIFPEYGIFPPGNRTEMKKYLEYIPDPSTGRINPCEESDNYSERPIIYTLSCMAKDNAIFVVANTGDIQNCTEEDKCPSDGVFHFNTNVVFDRTGTMVLKYHKEHLFFEEGMDLAREQQNTTFETDFGTFATYICFDLYFARVGDVGRQPEVDAIMFSTAWPDTFPQSESVQFFQSWALGNNVTLLASNIQLPGVFLVGSGLFHCHNGAIAYTYNPDGISKLVVANVPRKGFPSVPANDSITAIEATDTYEYVNDGDAVPMDCSRKLLNDSVDIYHDYRCLEATTMVNYTFVKLTDPSGHVEACNNGMCCSITYTSSGFGDEEFYLGVLNGTFDALDKYFWCEEDCFLSRCDAHGDVPCAVFPMKSNTVFQDVYIRAKFSTVYVYPQVVGSGMRLVPLTDWHSYSWNSPNDPHAMHPHFEHSEHHKDYKMGEMSVHFENKPGKSLISVGMFGRCYDRDPPYSP